MRASEAIAAAVMPLQTVVEAKGSVPLILCMAKPSGIVASSAASTMIVPQLIFAICGRHEQECSTIQGEVRKACSGVVGR
jgi:hypothetical protein